MAVGDGRPVNADARLVDLIGTRKRQWQAVALAVKSRPAPEARAFVQNLLGTEDPTGIRLGKFSWKAYGNTPRSCHGPSLPLFTRAVLACRASCSPLYVVDRTGVGAVLGRLGQRVAQGDLCRNILGNVRRRCCNCGGERSGSDSPGGTNVVLPAGTISLGSFLGCVVISGLGPQATDDFRVTCLPVLVRHGQSNSALDFFS